MIGRVMRSDPKRRPALVIAVLLLAITLLSIPGAFLVDPASTTAAFALGLACLATAAACAFVPWERVPALLIELAPAVLTIEAGVAIAVLDPVYGFFAVMIAAACAYAFASPRLAAGHVGVAVVALLVPALFRPSVSGEVVQAALLLTPLTVAFALLGSYVRERTEATALAYEAFASDALELATRIHTSVTGEMPSQANGNGGSPRRAGIARRRARTAPALRFPPAHGDPLLPALGSLAAAVLAISLIVIDPGAGDEADPVVLGPAPVPTAIELGRGGGEARASLARDRDRGEGASERRRGSDRDRRGQRPLGASAEETIASADQATGAAPAAAGDGPSSSAPDSADADQSTAQAGGGQQAGGAGGEPDVARENDQSADSGAPVPEPQSAPEPPPNLLDLLDDTLGLPHPGG